MVYRLLGDAVMLAHFGFLVFLAVGGFLAWRWPRLIVVHLATATWGLLIVTVGLTCPLTTWEDALRRRADGLGLERGFIDTYLTGVVYPAEYLLTVQLGVAVLVVVSWVGFAVRRRAARGSTRTSPGNTWGDERATSVRPGRVASIPARDDP